MKVSIIVLHKDNFDLLSKCLTSVEKYTQKIEYEIIIVDNGSTNEETLKYFATTKYRVIKYNHPFNFSKMNNLGVKEAKGKYLILLNDDVEVTKNWLHEMVATIEKYSNVGMVGCKLLYPQSTIIQHCGIVFGGDKPEHWKRGQEDCEETKYYREFQAVTHACVLIPRDIFNEVEGYDEKNIFGDTEDISLCFRIKKAGYRIIYCPKTILYHVELATRGKDMETKNKAWKNNIRLFLEQFGDMVDSDKIKYEKIKKYKVL